jgi:RNA polymerase sigma factor (sigma-70 family)
MQPRTTTIDLFSSFARFEQDRFRQWISDTRLRRNFQQHSSQLSPALSEKAWSLYWYKKWQEAPDQRLPPQHLAAYLQEPCYWAAQKTCQRCADADYSLADYFQIASSETDRILKGYNPTYGSSLQGYALVALGNVIKDYLRKHRAIAVSSNWVLLRRTSNKCILETLQTTGLSPAEIEQYHLAWTCFKALHTNPSQPQKSETTPPWSALSDLYNSQQPSAPLTPDQLKTRLTQLTRWIRGYLCPPIASLNSIPSGQDQGELQDSLPNHHSLSLLDAAIETETETARQTSRQQIHHVLLTALAQQGPIDQQILSLFYQDNLCQQDLAQKMAMSQSTISRRLKKTESTLLAALLATLQTQGDNLPNPTALKDISIALREWLQTHYRTPPGPQER